MWKSVCLAVALAVFGGALTGCSTIQGWFKPACLAQNLIVTGTVKAIVPHLDNAQPANIERDLKLLVAPLKLCAVQKTGPIAEAVCPIATPVLVAFVSSYIPADWGTLKPSSRDKLVEAVQGVCKKLPVEAHTTCSNANVPATWEELKPEAAQ